MTNKPTKFEEGVYYRFRSKANSAPAKATVNCVPVTKDGVPLKAGDIGVGDVIEADLSGAVLRHTRAKPRP